LLFYFNILVVQFLASQRKFIKMKKNNIAIIASMVLASITLVSCSSSIALTKVDDSREVKLPFSEKEYKTNAEFLRARANGESRDLQGGEMIARHNAEAVLANTIGTAIKGVTEQYFQNTSDNNSNDFSKKFESTTRSITNEAVSNIKIVDTKTLKKANGVYDTWMVIEVSKKSILAGTLKAMSNQKAFKLESDQAKFREIFEQEMSKLDN
jgi:hypothetical protein